MKFGVISFPGSNCDADLIYALRTNLGQQVVNLWHKDRDLQACDMVLLPGGFSYGDYLRSGAIARFSPIMQEVVRHAEKGGFVMGICNGFQMLTEAALLPGALLRNNSMNFICKNVFIKASAKRPWLQSAPSPMKIPIAHAEGNYFCGEDVLKQLQDQDQILFQYCDQEGNVVETANPNGSMNNIAGICNAAGNVIGMMPHPERASDPQLGNTDGYELLKIIIEGINSFSYSS